MAPKQPSTEDDRAPVARAREQLSDIDSGWWATLIGLAVVALAWALP